MAYRIALVLKYLDEEYQASIFRGAAAEAERLGMELICIQGDQFDQSISGSSFFFSSSSALRLDGVLFLSSILLDNNTGNISSRLINIFPTIPLVSIGTALKGIPSIVCETTRPIADLVHHLVSDHGYRRFLYLGGPRGNHDNRVREEAFTKTILGKKWSANTCTLAIRNGELFSETAGLQLIKQYCNDHSERDIDVILAGSDDMAAGIRKYLRTGAPESWRDCPLTGFDDIPLAATQPLALTTIHQPTERMGAAAARALHDVLHGSKTAPVLEIPGRTVLRNSCGCRGYTVSVPPEESERALRREQFLRDVSYFGQEIMGASSAEALERPLREFLTNVASRDFALVLYDSPVSSIPDKGRIQLHVSPLAGTQPFRDMTLRSMDELFDSLLKNPVNAGTPRCLFHLRAGDYRLGFVLYSVDQSAHTYMSVSGMFLSHAVNRLFELEHEQDRARELEREVEKRTRELKEEARKRREVEEAVLKISDLERLRFSLDLHDDICQRLAAMTMICKCAADSDPAMKTLFDMANETLRKTRQYAHESFPVEIDSLDLSDALNRLCSDMDTAEKPVISFTRSGRTRPLTREQKINVFRIAQEALQNVVKHAEAGKVTVQLDYGTSSVTLAITDDGHGYEQNGKEPALRKNRRRPRGLGIRSMEYRAHQMDGSFTITGKKGKGTRIEVVIPVTGGEQ